VFVRRPCGFAVVCFILFGSPTSLWLVIQGDATTVFGRAASEWWRRTVFGAGEMVKGRFEKAVLDEKRWTVIIHCSLEIAGRRELSTGAREKSPLRVVVVVVPCVPALVKRFGWFERSSHSWIIYYAGAAAHLYFIICSVRTLRETARRALEKRRGGSWSFRVGRAKGWEIWAQSFGRHCGSPPDIYIYVYIHKEEFKSILGEQAVI